MLFCGVSSVLIITLPFLVEGMTEGCVCAHARAPFKLPLGQNNPERHIWGWHNLNPFMPPFETVKTDILKSMLVARARPSELGVGRYEVCARRLGTQRRRNPRTRSVCPGAGPRAPNRAAWINSVAPPGGTVGQGSQLRSSSLWCEPSGIYCGASRWKQE